MTLHGPSKTIIVEPLEQPAEEAPPKEQPSPAPPAPEREPDKAPA